MGPKFRKGTNIVMKDAVLALRRTWAEVSLDAAVRNHGAIRAQIGGDCRLMAMVKADAYGHGAVALARLLQELGTDFLGVASLDEALELRRAGIRTPVLILGFTPADMAPVLIEHNLAQTIFDEDMARAMSRASAGCARALSVHLKVDTGMSRLGLVWRGVETLPALTALCRLPHLYFEGLFTHLPLSEAADDPETEAQIAALALMRDALAAEGIRIPICHCANSGAVIQYSKARFDMVRAGLLLYGLTPEIHLADRMDLVPAMRLCSVVSQVKTIDKGVAVSYGRTFRAPAAMRVAVVAAGYADGYPRALSGRACVLIAGRRAPILGHVCMDMMTVDVSDIPDVHAGDPVVLFGPELPVSELAALAGTISYELICSVGKRVPRVYLRGGLEVGRTNYLLGDEEYVTRWPAAPTPLSDAPSLRL
jgi:alanine racemase